MEESERKISAPGYLAALLNETEELTPAYRYMISELAPSFLHQFNNPLTIVIGSASFLAKSTAGSSDYRESIEGLSDGGSVLHELLQCYKNVLHAPIEKRRCDAEACCRDILRLCTPDFKVVSLQVNLSMRSESSLVSIPLDDFYLIFWFATQVCIYAVSMCMDDRRQLQDLEILLESHGDRLWLSIKLPPEIALVAGAASEKGPEQMQGAMPILPDFLARHLPRGVLEVAEEVEKRLRKNHVEVVWETIEEKLDLILKFPIPIL